MGSTGVVRCVCPSAMAAPGLCLGSESCFSKNGLICVCVCVCVCVCARWAAKHSAMQLKLM